MCYLPRQVHLNPRELVDGIQLLYSVTWIHHNQGIQALVRMEDVFVESGWVDSLLCSERRQAQGARKLTCSGRRKIPGSTNLYFGAFDSTFVWCSGKEMRRSNDG